MVSGLNDVTAPRTEADQARWRAAGSPATVQAEASTAAGQGTLGYRIGTGRPMVMRTDMRRQDLRPRPAERLVPGSARTSLQ